ncbi:uncharacterized protein LOC18435814 isoform X1 [Amborella trichopoda]|uniref:uncharacterized protein LOC18435814 isoform X1 n=1 Tax=Amborella trichopoda TaxID=13333 RepID=UPI0005D30B0C|nr:uncharacterized protein LOC18435814 isoform X1 [Amborella trichopoda]|eukprot:XP_011623989.1 uncharacterized protein LOC18435814 isoform X1 [Amborella trichopoda]
MGKEEEPLPVSIEASEERNQFCEQCSSSILRFFSLRCILALVLGACIFLSALFWLPPFSSLKSGSSDGHADEFKAIVQASFRLEKPMSLLSSHTQRLEYDIMDEIGVPNTKVSIISMEPLGKSNGTKVVFGVIPDSSNLSISAVDLSLLRESMIQLVLQQLNLSLTQSVFGKPSSFAVLKFPGGITVGPPQTASLWSRAQILFNFTLNNSVSQIQQNFDQLNGQLKYGLHLMPYENVYVQVTNLNGSTLAPPVVVQTTVLSKFEGHLRLPRLKQLAEMITGSSGKNLGLDNTVFGKVKQIELSSFLKHTLNAPQSSPSPSPSPSALSPFPSPSSLPPCHRAFSPSYPLPPSPDNTHQSSGPSSSLVTPPPYEDYAPYPQDVVPTLAPYYPDSPLPVVEPSFGPTPPAYSDPPTPSPAASCVHSRASFVPLPSVPLDGSPQAAVPSEDQRLGPAPMLHRKISPSPMAPKIGHDEEASKPPSSVASISPSPSSSYIAGGRISEVSLTGLLGGLLLHQILVVGI